VGHDWSQIYLYLGWKVYEKWRTPDSGKIFPEDIRVDSLTKGQEEDLHRLKEWIYRQRTKIRLERDKVERREKREEGVAKRKAEQPTLSPKAVPILRGYLTSYDLLNLLYHHPQLRYRVFSI
jgi:hypothetical protein